VSPLNIEGEYYECNFKEGEFIIPKDKWNHIFEDGKLNTKSIYIKNKIISIC